MVCYALLFVTLNYWQVGRQDELNARLDNTRAVRREFEQPRGEIVTADGVVIAQSVENPPGSDFRYQRRYPTGDLFAHITGYYTFAFGSTQLERSQNAVLTGETGEQQLRNLPGLITGADDSGTVVLTMRADLQQVAKDALGEREGAIVLMNPRSGAIQAMWSYPSYDPNQVADPDFATAQAVLTFLQAVPGDPLLANAYQQRYMPGSTFKIITTGIALTDGVTSPETVYPDASEWVPPQTDDPIENFGGTTCGGDLNEVFTRQLQHPVRPDGGRARPRPLRRRHPAVGPRGAGADRPAAPRRQHDRRHLQPRPGAARAGHARLRPERGPDGPAAHGDGRVDDRQRRPDDEAVRDRASCGPTTAPSSSRPHPRCGRPRSAPDVAATIGAMMVSVAETGTASCCIALDGGVPVAAKTGTAQLNGTGEPEQSHAWIVAYAPAERPPVRRRRDHRGHERRDLRQHRRPARRARRQDRPRRRRWPHHDDADSPYPVPAIRPWAERVGAPVTTNDRTAIINDRYEIFRRIGRGGMADVFLGRDRLLDRQVAIKVLFPEFAVDPNFVERFRREAQAAANLSHPNIVNVYDWGRHAGTYFIAMEYVEGRTLADILRANGHVTSKQAAEIASEVAAALGFAHEAGLVHRDIKPANILIGSNGQVKVADFGIARAMNAPTESNLTQAGAVMGTATYFSPEQAQGAQPDPRSDLYSLGVVMYEMIAGRPPFTGENPVSIAYKQVHDHPQPLNRLVADVPRPFEAIVAKLLAKDPKIRYSSAGGAARRPAPVPQRRAGDRAGLAGSAGPAPRRRRPPTVAADGPRPATRR